MRVFQNRNGNRGHFLLSLAVSLAAGLLLQASPLRANSTTSVLQPGPANGKQIWTTSVYSYAPGGSFPGGGLENDVLRTGGWGDLYYSLLQFDLGSMPTTAQSAYLELYCIPNSDTTTPLYLKQITQPWDWINGGTGRDHDRLWWADLPASVQIGGQLPAPTNGSWYAIDITDLYNSWQDGASANYGVMLQPAENWNTYSTFYSCNYMGDPTLRPELVVTSETVPEPASLSALGLCTLGALARRRPRHA